MLEHCLVFLRQHVGQRQFVIFRALAGLVFHEVHEVQLVAGLDAILGEVDDDVVALGNALGWQDAIMVLFVAIGIQVHAAVEGHCVLHDIAVVGDHVERHPRIGHART
ncbi:hypothetical protein D3C76_1478100 [compost metagenome]